MLTGKVMYCKICGKQKPKIGSRANWIVSKVNFGGKIIKVRKRDGMICSHCKGIKGVICR